ncbi:putative E3 ubiquitin-protein ligase HIP1 [Carex rostrata]
MASLSQFLAADLLADHQSPTSVSDESISSSSDTSQGLQALAGSTSPHICEHCGGLMSASEDRSVSLPSTSPIDGHQNPQIIQAVRHRDMDMDINNWSYEELLELEERIGKVNTGIKTSELSKFLKKVIFSGEQDEAERCVICQEQYADADVKGQLKCGHEYHFSCIGKWMEEQAVCPICRQRAAHFEQ